MKKHLDLFSGIGAILGENWGELIRFKMAGDASETSPAIVTTVLHHQEAAMSNSTKSLPVSPADLTPERIAKFWRWVDGSGGPDACWPWTGADRGAGYGHVKVNGRDVYAHRLAYFLFYGHWPSGLARHSCDNPPCCNPIHLQDGTHADNVADCQVRGRARPSFGEVNGRSVVTQDIVDHIRDAYAKDGATVRSVAPQFGISPSQVWRIVVRKNWS